MTPLGLADLLVWYYLNNYDLPSLKSEEVPDKRNHDPPATSLNCPHFPCTKDSRNCYDFSTLRKLFSLKLEQMTEHAFLKVLHWLMVWPSQLQRKKVCSLMQTEPLTQSFLLQQVFPDATPSWNRRGAMGSLYSALSITVTSLTDKISECAKCPHLHVKSWLFRKILQGFSWKRILLGKAASLEAWLLSCLLPWSV